MGGNDAVLLLGSNQGRRVLRIRDAVNALAREARVRSVSRFYSSEPFGRRLQPWFLNVAVRIGAEMAPWDLLALAKRLEREAGRVAAGRWGPRPLDVDIILMGSRTVMEPGLVVPHPSMALRRFCLAPVAEVAPEAVVPPGKRTVAELLATCEDTLEVTAI
ncbi:MAG: 2-amino-4-hydroxy-6-hydroxymethyldihydropteridine diphosphokinase [Thermodesulfobacteriota bacterium]